MTLASSGEMSIGGSTANRSINVEFGRSATATTSMSQLYRGGGIVTTNNTSVPTSGAISISNFYGATSRPALSYVFSSNTVNASVNVTTISGYIAGISDITITINNGIWVYATTTANAGLTLTGGTTGDTITLVNNGFIAGMGGNGGGGNSSGANGGIALQLGFNTTINNTNAAAYIGGGGGGGAGYSAIFSGVSGGGGGAGGGNGAAGYSSSGGAGGAIGSAGSNGTGESKNTNGYGRGGGSGGGGASSAGIGSNTSAGGGGGGRIFPGTGGSPNGGSGSSAASAAGSSTSGGGGGWGASGSAAYTGAGLAGAGGKAVNLNGKAVTWVSGDTTRVYGSVA